MVGAEQSPGVASGGFPEQGVYYSDIKRSWVVRWGSWLAGQICLVWVVREGFWV